ncbi:sodium:proton antiporter [Neptuniibacter sp.]|uniref:cation:proton antiporter n=1 Tax=Neptuniibacter sp. TaxID=1962643 RepID=UPI002618886E|nr:sodium:proton antiporter [Neptuniibacter sp.]MCP4595474.1 sodium:proton antiporter [Neptuniibacter sp.]
MDTANLILLFIAMLLVAAMLQPLSQFLKLPHSLLLVLAGFIGSEVVVSLGVDTGLRWYHFHTLVFYIFLPALIFESALHIDLKALLKKLFPILLLSTPMMLLATLVSAAFLYWGIGYPDYFPWLAALLCGALLSATDPAAVISLFKKVGVSDEVILLLEGESLFNDAVAILLFGLFSSLLLMPGETFSVTYAVERFALVFLGGTLVGVITFALMATLFLFIRDNFARMIFMVSATYGGYLVAESVLHLSGVMSVLVAGLGFGELLRRENKNGSTAKDQSEKLAELWRFNGQLAETLIFLLLGMTITWGMFEQQWLAMLLGIAAVLISRAAGLLVTMPVINLFSGSLSSGTKVNWQEQIVLYWGGVRGAVTIALALSLPLELESWFTIQSIAYGVVLFSLCIQTSTTPLLVKAIKLKRNK